MWAMNHLRSIGFYHQLYIFGHHAEIAETCNSSHLHGGNDMDQYALQDLHKHE